MADVSVVAVGTVAATGADTTLTVTTPAGASGDMVIFFLTHDDYTDGIFVASSPPITLTSIFDGAPQLGTDARQGVFRGIEDQAAGRGFTFTWNNTEQAAGVCVRFAGQDGTTPIQAGSSVEEAGPTIASGGNADRHGDMFVNFVGGDLGTISTSVPTGWTERVNGTDAAAHIWVGTRTADKYPFPQILEDMSLGSTLLISAGHSYTFVIAKDTSISFTLNGITKDKDGVALGSCEVALFREVGGTPPDYQFVESVTSNASTGAYSFTVHEDPSQFMVVSIKDDTPHVFDVTDNVLQPT